MIPAVCAVIAACELQHVGVVLIDVDDVIADYAGAPDLARDLLVSEGDRLVAEMLVTNGRYANGSVHPDFEGCAIGTAFLHWSREVARTQGATVVGGTVPDENEPARELFLANGYEPYWESWILEIRHDGEPVPPSLPEGVLIRPFEPGEEITVHRVIDDAFAGWESRPRTTFEDWRAWVLGRRGSSLGCSQWFPTAARSSGPPSCDSRTGARTMYEHVGMRVSRSFTHHASEL